MHSFIDALHSASPALPETVIAVKLAVALAIGLLIGFERQWSNKDFGIRTFSCAAFLGALSALISSAVLVTALCGIISLAIVLNIRDIITSRSVEGTTSLALILTFVLGALSGYGHIFTATASGIIITWLLSLKPQFQSFAGGVTPLEIRSALLLGLFGLVIFPLLPSGHPDPWGLFYPREAWLTILVLACIGFVNYVLLRFYGVKSILFSAVLGGLVNSTATAAELSSTLLNAGLLNATFVAVLLTSAAMFIRNLALVVLFEPKASRFAFVPLFAMASSAGWFAWSARSKEDESEVRLKLESPISLAKVFRYGVLFCLIQIAGNAGTRWLGNAGLLLVSILGGTVSSASTTVAAANLSAHGSISPYQAAVATVVTSLVSTMMNLPLIFRHPKARPLFSKTILSTFVQILVGTVVILGQKFVIERCCR